MKVGIIISAGCRAAWAMRMGFIIARVLPWEALELEPPCLPVAPAWIESRRGAKKQKSIAFASYISLVRGTFIKRRPPRTGGELFLYFSSELARSEGEKEFTFQSETQFCLQMQFNELWLLLGDWAAGNVGAVRNLHPGLGIFGSNVSVLIQRFWRELIPLSAEKADTESLLYGLKVSMYPNFLLKFHLGYFIMWRFCSALVMSLTFFRLFFCFSGTFKYSNGVWQIFGLYFLQELWSLSLGVKTTCLSLAIFPFHYGVL